jgi:hypothetical protein
MQSRLWRVQSCLTSRVHSIEIGSEIDELNVASERLESGRDQVRELVEPFEVSAAGFAVTEYLESLEQWTLLFLGELQDPLDRLRCSSCHGEHE